MYRLLILGDDATWGDEVWDAVAAAAEAVLRRRTLERLDELPSIGSHEPVAVVDLGDERSAGGVFDDDHEEARRRAFGSFSVPPGDDFQRRLDIELADKAYVLTHHLALLALTLPDARFVVIEWITDRRPRGALHLDAVPDLLAA